MLEFLCASDKLSPLIDLIYIAVLISSRSVKVLCFSTDHWYWLDAENNYPGSRGGEGSCRKL